MNMWVSPAEVREYVNLGGVGGRYADSPIGSNIRAAQTMIQRQANRQFEAESATKIFSTDGKAAIAIPDLRSATSVTLQSAVLTADSSYWLLADAYHSGVYVGIQLRAYQSASPWTYKANPEWWDRNLDSPWYWMGGGDSSLPNDLSITGNWGWTSKPDDVLLGVKALAAWLTKRADAVLAGAVQEPGTGAIFDYTQWPPEAQSVIASYRRGEVATIIG